MAAVERAGMRAQRVRRASLLAPFERRDPRIQLGVARGLFGVPRLVTRVFPLQLVQRGDLDREYSVWSGCGDHIVALRREHSEHYSGCVH